jgi:hypothetical protein
MRHKLARSNRLDPRAFFPYQHLLTMRNKSKYAYLWRKIIKGDIRWNIAFEFAGIKVIT